MENCSPFWPLAGATWLLTKIDSTTEGMFVVGKHHFKAQPKAASNDYDKIVSPRLPFKVANCQQQQQQ